MRDERVSKLGNLGPAFKENLSRNGLQQLWIFCRQCPSTTRQKCEYSGDNKRRNCHRRDFEDLMMRELQMQQDCSPEGLEGGSLREAMVMVNVSISTRLLMPSVMASTSGSRHCFSGHNSDWEVSQRRTELSCENCRPL